MKLSLAFPLLALALAPAASAHAWEFRTRFVERVGSTDIPLPDDTLELIPGSQRDIRIQFGVFDDADGPAPAGGFVGWNIGTIDVSGSSAGAVNRRNPGRLSPFTFSQGPNANGFPAPDPFSHLTEIDATLGIQSPFWGFDPDGAPLPQPQPVVRDLNSFVSVYAFSTRDVGFASYSITAAGALIAAQEWRTIGSPTPPDPDTMTPGAVTYAPFPSPPRAFSAALRVIVPAPASVSAFAAAGVFAARRRR